MIGHAISIACRILPGRKVSELTVVHGNGPNRGLIETTLTVQRLAVQAALVRAKVDALIAAQERWLPAIA
jgi:carbamate kinase